MSDEYERETVERSFTAELQEGDGRTVEALVVPYGQPAVVSDGGEPYTEQWEFGAFSKQTRAADKVKVFLNFEHEPGLRGIIGRASALVERTDGLYGTFRVMDNSDGNKALELVREGLLGGISLEAITLRSVRENGLVRRVRAHLDKVSLCRFPAFADARVLAVRDGVPDPDPDPEPVEPEPVTVPAADDARSSEVDAVLRQVGYEPLVRRAVSGRAWNGSTSRFTDEEYERSCLVCRPGDEPPKTRCSLPVLEPNGDVNTNALAAAAARLNQMTGVTGAMRAQAARKLVRYYRQADMEPPDHLRAMAARH